MAFLQSRKGRLLLVLMLLVVALTAAGTSAALRSDGGGGMVQLGEVEEPSPPILTGIDVNSGNQAATYNVTVDGIHLSQVDSVSFGDGIEASILGTGPGSVSVRLAIDATASAGTRDVTVTSPAGSDTLARAFKVTGQPAVAGTVPARDKGCTISNGPLAPEEPGPYAVGYYRVSYEVPEFGTYHATVRYPAVKDGLLAAADKSGVPYPGIVASSGWLAWESTIAWIPEHLVSRGYVTLCFTPPNPTWYDPTMWAQGFNEGIEKLKAENKSEQSAIHGLLDDATLGVIGLSMGGSGCLKATAGNPEIKTAVALAPGGIVATPFALEVGRLYGAESSPFEGIGQDITVPVQTQLGSNDIFIRRFFEDAGHSVYDEVPNTTAKSFLEIRGGNHVGYADMLFEWTLQLLSNGIIDGKLGISIGEQHRISRKYFTAWFDYYLKGVTEYEPYLFGEEAEKDLNSGVLTRFECNKS